MAANSTIDLINLDPDLNKAAFIAYLKTQSRFKDYDFAGSDISILLDILSLNYYRHGFFLNMDINEHFIDSAQLPADIRSHAKELNYTPRSATSASCNVTCTFTATGFSQPYIIPKGSQFGTQIKNKTFTFSTPQTITCASANNSFSFTTPIFEGIYVKDSYIFNNTGTAPKTFKLTNQNADTSSIVVNVFQNGSTLGQNYNLATSLLDLTANSNVFFLQCSADDGNYEILFGDGILGNQPLNGSLIVIDYRLSSGSAPNGAGNFAINFDPTANNELTSPVNIFANTNAAGGAPIEDIEATRFYAPRFYQVQERMIVPSDYNVALKQKFPEIQAVNAYGGETVTPPQFGKVYIAIQLTGVNGLPVSKQQQYAQFVKGRNPISIQPIFVAADNTFIQINMIVRYNINVTTETDSRITSEVATAINNYNNLNLLDFDSTFRLQPFQAFVANTDPSIVSCPTTISVYKKINPTQVANNFVLNYQLPLESDNSKVANIHSVSVEKTIASSNFFFKGNLSQLEDDGAGTVRIMHLKESTLYFTANVGTVDYVKGIVRLNEFTVDSFSGSNLLVYAKPADDDITSSQNTLFSIEQDQLNIAVQQLQL